MHLLRLDAQIERALAGVDWPDELTADVAAITAADFDVVEATGDNSDIDTSLDLFAIAVRI